VFLVLQTLSRVQQTLTLTLCRHMNRILTFLRSFWTIHVLTTNVLTITVVTINVLITNHKQT
jgi:hypothetical protein